MATRPILIGGDTGGPLRGFAPEPISLSTLKAAGVAIEWHEGVAIVQEAARRLLESKSPQGMVELSGANVRIDLTGAVFVPRDGVQDGPAAVSQLGALLRDMLPDNLPVPLRLAVSQAMSNPPHYVSIASFSEALSYFERPDPSTVIRAVYERWEANGAGRPTPHGGLQRPMSIDGVAEQAAADEDSMVTKPRATARATPRWLFAAGGIGLVITLALVLAAVMLRSSGTQSAEGLADLRAMAARLAESMTSDPPAVAGAQPDATQTRPVASAQSAATTPAINRSRPAPAARLNPGRPSTTAIVRPARPAPSGGEAPAPIVVAGQAGGQPPSAAGDPPIAVTDLEIAPGSQIYSSLDADVAAPRAAYPQSPAIATVLHDDEVITFDVVIDQAGKVESVKLRRAPTTIRSALMLTMSMSVAKAWRFQPATRHGQSVKYRQSISVPAPR